MMRVLSLFCALCLVHAGSPVYAQERCVSAADRAVVMLEVVGIQYGAGVVIGIRGADIFILTVKHVVADRGAEVKARFSVDRKTSYPALISNISTAKDAAFVVAHDANLAEILRQAIAWDSLPAKSSSTEYPYVTIIGNSGGEGWTKSDVPERVIARNANAIKVEALSTRPGSSGGGVFDQSEQLVGIVSDENGQVAGVVPIDVGLKEASGFGIPVDLTENRAATPAVYVGGLKGAPGDWGDEVAAAVRQKLGSFRRVIECENDKAVSMKGRVEFRSPTLTTDVAVITWQFNGRKNVPAAASTQYLTINRLPWKHAISDPDVLTDKTDEAADFAVAAVTKYMR